MINNRIVYIVKKEHKGTASNMFFAYDYEKKVQLSFNKSKDSLIEFLKKQNFGVLDE